MLWLAPPLGRYEGSSHTFTLEILAKKGVAINGGGAIGPADPSPILQSGDTLTIGKTVRRHIFGRQSCFAV